MKKFLGLSIGSIVVLSLFFFLPYGTWASIGDLPAHPLVVHGVVVLLPLVAIALLVGAWKIRLLERHHLLLILLATISTVGVMVAKSSGDSLSAAVGLPEKHAEWGNNLVPLAMVLVASLILLSFFTFYRRMALISSALRGLLVILGIATLAMTYVVGHSGAEAVWKDRYAAAKVPLALSLDEFTAEEVAQHNTATDCWTIVEGFVYDVTTFANRHPAGSSAIKEMCGVNASEDYLDEHDGQREPSQWLETLKIGKLK